MGKAYRQVQSRYGTLLINIDCQNPTDPLPPCLFGALCVVPCPVALTAFYSGKFLSPWMAFLPAARYTVL